MDKFVYVHQFSTKKQGMKLVATLSGHFSEVTQVKWNSFMKKWVTASEDGTIRTWVSLAIVHKPPPPPPCTFGSSKYFGLAYKL